MRWQSHLPCSREFEQMEMVPLLKPGEDAKSAPVPIDARTSGSVTSDPASLENLRYAEHPEGEKLAYHSKRTVRHRNTSLGFRV